MNPNVPRSGFLAKRRRSPAEPDPKRVVERYPASPGTIGREALPTEEVWVVASNDVDVQDSGI